MYVIYPAAEVVDESYLALISHECELPPPTGITSVSNQNQLRSIYHDTGREQLNALKKLHDSTGNALPDLLLGNLQLIDTDYKGKIRHIIPTNYTSMASAVSSSANAASAAGLNSGPIMFSADNANLLSSSSFASAATASGRSIRDLIHPSMTESLKDQQQSAFRLVKTVSDFTHALSKIHEQYADDLQSLCDNFRRANMDLRPGYNNSIFNVWESILSETEMDAMMHSDFSSVLSRAVSRPLLEKTFHMKIQSKKVFTNRESFENVLRKTEDMLIKCHSDYCISMDVHTQQKSSMSAGGVIDAHNDYVLQLHAANGMIDQYYHETLPELLQELDYVYQDVGAVVTECLMQGTDLMALKTADCARRYDVLRRRVKEINPVSDLSTFIRCLNVPDSLTINKHMFAPPQPRDLAYLDGLPALRDELLVDRTSQNAARNRFDSLRKESQELEMQIRQLSDALETLVRIQAKSLESQLYNKANEIQEDITIKRFDQRLAQIHLAAVRAQKEMFASKVDGSGGGGGGGIGGSNMPAMTSAASGLAASGVVGNLSSANMSADLAARERKLSSSSSGTGSMKNKWVKAFKSIKGGKDVPEPRFKGTPKFGNFVMEALMSENRNKNGKDQGGFSGSGIENAHIFQEYTYKKITPCDICSQILRGHTRQGLKCKLCRINVHPDCQDQSQKCQPKSKILRRQKSASELEARYFGDPADNDSISVYGPEAVDANLLSPWGASIEDRRANFRRMKSYSMDSAKSSSSKSSDPMTQNRGPTASDDMMMPSAGGGPPSAAQNKSFGGSYSAASGCSSKVIAKTLNIRQARPKLADVAMALLHAKAAGELPSALGRKAVQERLPTDLRAAISQSPEASVSTVQDPRSLQSST